LDRAKIHVRNQLITTASKRDGCKGAFEKQRRDCAQCGSASVSVDQTHIMNPKNWQKCATITGNISEPMADAKSQRTVVELSGIEPLTSSLRTTRSPN
jgi:hypothetical protein